MSDKSNKDTQIVLVVEDDRDLREALCDTLELAGFATHQTDSGEAALAWLGKQRPDLVVSDVNMGGISGHELLEQLQAQYPYLPVLLMTAYGDIGHAVSAMRHGAADYLVKPFKPQVLVDAVRSHIGGRVIEQGDQPVAEDPVSQEAFCLARRVAGVDATVLIAGESGTGKEVVARYIHQHSSRSAGPFIAINCAAIPENMLEATLFGYEKGAFTGAYNSHAGKFEQADGGTLLLDEISEMDLGLQAKLLRVLQEREVERVGGKKVISLDVRVVATTNRDLQSYVQEGKFREDLYYRLSVFPMQLTPLRQRSADILPLARKLLAVHAGKMNKAVPALAADAEQKLLAHAWQGNVRELDNVVQRALILHSGQQVTANDVMLVDMTAPVSPASPVSMAPTKPAAAVTKPGDDGAPLGDDLQQHEFQLIVDALQAEGGRKNKAAEKLGISPRTLRYKMAKMRESGWNPDTASLVAAN